MPFGYIRAGLIAAFAVIFGIVQLLCACMDVPGTEVVSPQSRSTTHIAMSDRHHHTVLDMAGQDVPSHDHGNHDHEADCSHCDDAVILATTADTASSFLTMPSDFKATCFDRVLDTRANMEATNLVGRRWLDPPKRMSSPDPVILHNRSLI